jgi:hypothetical protein
MSPLGHLVTLFFVGALLALCSAIGLACLKRINISDLRPLEKLPVSILVGGGALATAFLGLGAGGWLEGWSLAGAALVAAVAVRRRFGEHARLVRGASAELAALVPVPLLGLFAGVTLLQLVLSLAPPTDYDSLMYHVDVPLEFLHAGTIHLSPDNLHVAQVGLAHMLYLPLLAFAGYAAPAVLELAFAALLAVMIAAMLDRLAGREASALAFTTVWGTIAFTLSAQTAKVDVALVTWLLAGQLMLMHAPKSLRPEAVRCLAGVLVGFAIGVKLHAALYAVALVPMAYGFAPHPSRVRSRVRGLVVFGLGVAAGALPWLVKNWVLLGAPMYPVLAEAHPPPWLQEAYGTFESLAIPAPLAETALARARAPFNLLDLLLAPGRMTAEAEGRMYFLHPLTLAAPFALVALQHRSILAFALPALLYFGGLLLYSRYLNLRYLIPALIPLAALGAAVTGVALRKLRAASPPVLMLVAGVSLLPALLVISRQLSVKNGPEFLLRSQRVTRYLGGVDDYEIRSHIAIVNRMNAALARPARVLMLFEGRGLYFEVPVLQDNVLTNWPFVVASRAADDCLSRAGITHVLVGESTLRYFTHRGLDPNDLAWGEFAAFQSRCLDRVYANRDYTLYQVAAQKQ